MSRVPLREGSRRWRRSAFVAFLLLVALGVTACGTAPVGVVDSQRLLNESVLALSFQKQLDDREKAMAADLRLLSGTLGKEDLDARREQYRRELDTVRRGFEDQLNAQIRKTVAEVARQRRLRVVLIKQGVPLGGIDVTADVIARLK